MKRIVLIIGSLISAMISISATAQSCYEETGKNEWKKHIQCANIDYSVSGDPLRICVENSQNTLLHQRNYKVGSNPRIYYGYADGMCDKVEVDKDILLDIERNVFSDLEIEDYTENPGFLTIIMAVNPGTGRVEEVCFIFYTIWEFRNWPEMIDKTNWDSIDKHIFGIPIDKLRSLELLLKERMVCQISQRLQEQMPLYAPAGFDLFYKAR